jgi:riboflavin kinase
MIEIMPENAQLPASLFQSALEEITNGVYFGWAVIERRGDAAVTKGRNTPVKAVVNVGYSPTFEGEENKERIVEAHLITKGSPMAKPEPLTAATDDDDDRETRVDNDDAIADEIEGDFYDETMRLQLIGYLRPEQKFDSFPELIAQIHRDIGNANWALDSMPFVFSREDEFVKDGGAKDWIGSGGGDAAASWEYESW